MLPRKAERHLFRSQPLVGPGVEFQNPLPDFHIFLLPAGRLAPEMLVICTPVDLQHPAENSNGVLARQGIDGI